MKPNCIFFDIDGTMIGDIGPQVWEWEFLMQYEPGKIQQFKKNLCTQLLAGLLRPGLSNFIDFIKSKHEHVELFIYTASDTKWAQFLVPCIESVTGIRFNRPLFTRKNCTIQHGTYIKSLHRVIPTVQKKLRQTHGSVEVSLNNCTLIDNNPVLIKGEESRLIICPTYHYINIYDILRLMSEDVLRSNYSEMRTRLFDHGLFPDLKSEMTDITEMYFPVFKVLYYTALSKCMKDNLKDEKQGHKDPFWNRLGQLMSNAGHSFKDSSLKAVNRGLK